MYYFDKLEVSLVIFITVNQSFPICGLSLVNSGLWTHRFFFHFPLMFLLYMPYRGLTDESEILKFLQHGTLVGLLPVPHPILIRKYQSNPGTTAWFRTYMWAVIFLRYKL